MAETVTDVDPAYDFYSELYERLAKKKSAAFDEYIASIAFFSCKERAAKARYNAFDACMDLANEVLDHHRKAIDAREALEKQVRGIVREELDAKSTTAQPTA